MPVDGNGLNQIAPATLNLLGYHTPENYQPILIIFRDKTPIKRND